MFLLAYSSGGSHWWQILTFMVLLLFRMCVWKKWKLKEHLIQEGGLYFVFRGENSPAQMQICYSCFEAKDQLRVISWK